MARNETAIHAPLDIVWAVLSDPRPYARFVVGTKRIRTFDPAWPDVGSRLHHTVGVGPFMLRDTTDVIHATPPRQLHLHAGLRPFLVSNITFTLEPLGERSTRLIIEEHAERGPLAAVWNPLLDGAMWLRNQELLRRLRGIAERRSRTSRPRPVPFPDERTHR